MAEHEHPFGYCLYCGNPLSWNSDGDMGDTYEDDENWQGVPVTYLHCGNCGASVEIVGCNNEEKKNYPFWDNQNSI